MGLFTNSWAVYLVKADSGTLCSFTSARMCSPSPGVSSLFHYLRGDMAELKRRIIPRIGDIVVFDNGYYPYDNQSREFFK